MSYFMPIRTYRFSRLIVEFLLPSVRVVFCDLFHIDVGVLKALHRTTCEMASCMITHLLILHSSTAVKVHISRAAHSRQRGAALSNHTTGEVLPATSPLSLASRAHCNNGNRCRRRLVERGKGNKHTTSRRRRQQAVRQPRLSCSQSPSRPLTSSPPLCSLPPPKK